MSKFEANLELPVEDLKERRRILEAELSKVVVEIVTTDIKSQLNEELAKSPVKISRLSWDFYPESDDEGGSDWYVCDLSAYDENGDYIETEEIEIEKISYDGKPYMYNLRDVLSDFMSDYSSDLYDEDITEIIL